jgi:endonuclease YncB( thermonuclease family)
MPELSLPACPICQAQDSLSRQSRTMQEQLYIWYECQECGSVLLRMGDDRWAYQKVGQPEKAFLLKQPLTSKELTALTRLAATKPLEKTEPVSVDNMQGPGPAPIIPETTPAGEVAPPPLPAPSPPKPLLQEPPLAALQGARTWLQGSRRRLWAVIGVAIVTICCFCCAVTSLFNPSPGTVSTPTPTPALAEGSQIKLVSDRDDSVTAWQMHGDCELGDALGQLPSGTDAFLLDALCYYRSDQTYYYQVATADGTECWIRESEIVPLAKYTPPPTTTSLPTDTPVATMTQEPTAERTEAQVVEVVDGDTIKVSIQGEIYALRYIGIDTPEMDQQFGGDAAAANAKLVEDQTVYLEKDVSETDSYDRLLRYVYLADGTFVSAELVRLGLARAKAYPPDTKFQDVFEQAQLEAQGAEVGIWKPIPTAVPTQPPPADASPAQVIIVAVNKQDEYVDIKNIGGADQDLTGWVLLSERGSQSCALAGILRAGQTLRIWAMAKDGARGGYNCGFGSNIWNNSQSDPAVLYNGLGQEVDRK